MKTKGRKLALILSALFIASNGVSFAKSNVIDSKNNSGASSIAGKTRCGIQRPKDVPMHALSKTIKAGHNSYQPYLQFGGTRFFHMDKNNNAATADIFVPIWQQDLSHLLFTDLRVNDRSGTPFEGNVHVGYRHLSADNQKSFGVYGAFDRRKTEASNYFNQLTLGGEYWLNKFFLGGNLYQPIGDTTRTVSTSVGLTESNDGAYRSINVTKNLLNEKAMPGVDAEVGYELRDGLVGYVGGYYFGANNVSTVCGPRARVTYDWSLASGRRILGVFDKVGLEAGVQNDKPRGTIAYLSANVRVGWLPQKHEVLQGVSRHMVDPVRRDIDIVSGDNTTQTTYDPIVVKTTTSATEVANVYAQNENVTVIDPAFVISDAEANTIAAAMQTSQSPAILAVTDDLSIAEITGDSTLKGTIRMAREGGITSSGNTILNQPTNNERIRVAENSIVRNEITSTNMDSAVHLFASPAQPILSDASIPITDAQAQPGFVDVDAVDANAELQSTGLSTPDVQSVEGSSGTPNLTEGFVGDKPTEGGSGSSSPAVTDHESLDDGVSVADGLSVSGGAHGTLSTYRNATNLYKALSKDPTIANIILDSDDQDQIDLLAKGFAKGYGKKIRSQFVDSLTAEQAQVFATALANSRDSDVATTTGFVETMRTLKGYIIQ